MTTGRPPPISTDPTLTSVSSSLTSRLASLNGFVIRTTASTPEMAVNSLLELRIDGAENAYDGAFGSA